MSSKVISIEINLHLTKICEVDYHKKNPQVYHCITFETPENTYEDGYIRDKEGFAALLKDKIKEANMKSRKMVFTIASSKIANREVLIPFVKKNRIQDVVNANASEYFPVNISDYLINYCILQKIVTKESRKLKLLVVAAPDNLIRNYYNIAEIMGYEITAIDYFGNSIQQFMRKQVDGGNNLFIQLNEQTTLINIMEAGSLELQRTLPYGTAALLQTLVGNQYFSVTNEQEADILLCTNEIIQKQLDSINEEVAVSLTAYQDNSIGNSRMDDEIADNVQAIEDVMDSLRYLVSNILRVLDYYYSRNKEKKINKIYISGQGSEYKGIDRLLEHETEIEVKTIKDLNSVTFSKNIDLSKINPSEYISCIGAVYNPICFEPREQLLRDRKKTSIYRMILVFSSAILFSIYIAGNSFFSYRSALQENNRLISEISKLSEINHIYSEYEQSAKTFESVNTMYQMTAEPNDHLNELITELEEKLPTAVLVETMNVTSTDITLSIRTDSKERAAKTLIQLKTIQALAQINTNELKEAEDENGVKSVEMVISGKYRTQK